MCGAVLAPRVFKTMMRWGTHEHEGWYQVAASYTIRREYSLHADFQEKARLPPACDRYPPKSKRTQSRNYEVGRQLTGTRISVECSPHKETHAFRP